MSIIIFNNELLAADFIANNSQCWILQCIDGSVEVRTGADIPVQPPAVLCADAWKVKVVLSEQGFLSVIDAYVATQSVAVQLAWAGASVFQNDNAMILAWASSAGKVQADVDAIFQAAMAIA